MASNRERGLTPKQTRFVAEYLVDMNGTQAAVRAGYSARTANEQASRLLVNANIAVELARQRSAMAKRADRTIDDVMAEIRRIGDQAEAEGEWMPALKARELEAKRLGAFAPDVHQTNIALVFSRIERVIVEPSR